MFFKITFKTETQRLTRWATNLRRTKNGTVTFVIVSAEGLTMPDESVKNIVIAQDADIVSIKPARMNLKYAELEVIPTTPKQGEALVWMIGSTKERPYWAPGALCDQCRKLVDLGVLCYKTDGHGDNEMFWVRGDGEPTMTYGYDVCACYAIDSETYHKRTGQKAPIMVVLKYNTALSTKAWRSGTSAAVKALGYKNREVLWGYPTMMDGGYYDRTKHPKYEIK